MRAVNGGRPIGCRGSRARCGWGTCDGRLAEKNVGYREIPAEGRRSISSQFMAEGYSPLRECRFLHSWGRLARGLIVRPTTPQGDSIDR